MRALRCRFNNGILDMLSTLKSPCILKMERHTFSSAPLKVSLQGFSDVR